MASTWGASWGISWGLSWGGAEQPAEPAQPSANFGDSIQPRRRVRRILPPPPLREPELEPLEPVTVARNAKPAAPVLQPVAAIAPVMAPAAPPASVLQQRTRAERDEELLLLLN